MEVFVLKERSTGGIVLFAMGCWCEEHVDGCGCFDQRLGNQVEVSVRL
jgi:hypothetical protein